MPSIIYYFDNPAFFFAAGKKGSKHWDRCVCHSLVLSFSLFYTRQTSLFTKILSDGVKWSAHLLCEYWIFLLMTCSQQAWRINDNALLGRSAFTFRSVIFQHELYTNPSLSCNSSPWMHFTTLWSWDNPTAGIWQWTWIITASTLTLV